MQVSAHADVDVVAVEQDDQVTVMLELVAPTAQTDEPRPAAWPASRPVLAITPDAPVSTRSATWEQLYAALPATDARLAALRNYMWNKSAGLRPAFRLDQASGSRGPDNRH